jgi:hypothetical protein
MMLRSMLSVLVLASSSLVVGCAADTDKDASSSNVMLTGNVGGSSGAGSAKTQSYGSVSTASAGLHVTAHEVHARGIAGRNVDVTVASDGSFNVGLDRGKRWLITVDDAEGHSAIVTFGNGQNVLSVSANSNSSRVDVGGLSVIGGEARSAIQLDTRLGIEATLAGLDDVFEAANGAIIAAQKAVEEARLAAEAALKAADSALDAAEQARKAAEEAARLAAEEAARNGAP